MRSVVVIAVLAAGCRFSFDARNDAGGGGSDDAMDDAMADAHIFDAAPDGVLATTCGTFAARECDGFEAGTFDPMWILDASRGMVLLDTTFAYRGSASAHMHINQIVGTNTNPRALLQGPGGLVPQINGMIYFRVWMYVATPLFDPVVMNQFINAANLGGQGISMGVTNHKVANNDYTSQMYQESTTLFPLDKWTCVQFQIPSNVVGTSRVFIDGAELTDAALTNTSAQPPPDHVYLGLEWVGTFSSMPAADAWLDEIAIDTAPIPCAQ